ncbi:hypothetical protein ACI01nite_00120 [Acetobacter cibinongensis]|uniref:Phage DNA recombinase n=1 Tax=Acetobacter cibinongensis TaxID=146475 RepID=A0A0D6N7I0_9PROT|nr:site-specific integrase [Acetobacter cibinongensis]GAN61518.1 phage DNA recombinase [Acetobacter cibinongensis]GEL57410.1 hypothetical protein ACI01nite_00120 [Acetobacter cibinongensis]
MKDQISSAKIDPATGRPFPAGVEYRGKGQYRARKRIRGGERIHQSFSTAKLARRWLDTTSTKLELGQFEDARPLERQTVHELVDRYVHEVMQARDNDRKGHIPSVLQDEIAQLPLVDLTPTAVRSFRDRLAEKYSAATVVKRLNLLAAICQHAIAEWDLPFSKNPAAATAVKRPADADKMRNRRLIGDEYDRLLEAMATSPWPDDLIFVQFAIEQGTRREEALARHRLQSSRFVFWENEDHASRRRTWPRNPTTDTRGSSAAHLGAVLEGRSDEGVAMRARKKDRYCTVRRRPAPPSPGA